MLKPAAKSWFNLTRNSASEGTVDFFDEIGYWGVTAKDFVQQLRAFGPIERLSLNIDCPGGDCNDGFTIFDAIKGTNAEVTANITGLAASMASVIMLAAKTIRIAENGRVMVHRVTSAAIGDADELDAAARTARQFEDRIVQLYMARTNQDEHTVREWMKAQNGTWFFGQEAVANGFADSVITGAKARAFQQRWAGMFTMLPTALFDISSSQPTTPIMKKLSTAQKSRLDELLATDHLDEADKAELQTLSDQAKAEGYDPSPAPVKDTLTLAQITSHITASVKPLEDRITAQATEIENLKKLGLQNLAGGPPVAGVQQDIETKAMTSAEFKNLDHPARNKFMRTGGKITG